MISASIDIGTNTVLLLVAEIKNGKLKVLEEKQRIPRLGKYVDQSKILLSASVQRVLDVLKEYKQYLIQNYPEIDKEKTVVTATSAVRDASNKDEFLDLIYKETSWNVRLLSGDEEAETTYKGALSVLEDRSDKANLILDIGGGSTELAFGTGYELKEAVSIDMGSVRFTERFFAKDPPGAEQIAKARAEIQRLLENIRRPEALTGSHKIGSESLTSLNISEKDFDLIGVAGTITSVAGIEMNLGEYSAGKLNQFRLRKDAVEQYIDEFSELSSEEIEQKYPVFLKGRGEVVLAGILILKEVMEWSRQDFIITSTGGIRHGMLLS